MKQRMLLFFLVACLAATCSRNVSPGQPTPTATPAPPLPHSMKGYELYSWPVGEQWHFTLITGTNRNKTVEEITTGDDRLAEDGWVRIHVQGLDAILALLSRIPEGEWLFWAGPRWSAGVLGAVSDITLPPQATIDAVKQHCEPLGIRLQVSE